MVVSEFRIWTDTEVMPSTEEILNRLLIENPGNPENEILLRKEEIALLTHDSLDIFFTSREEDPSLFPTDVNFTDSEELTPVEREFLSEVHSVIVLRFSGDDPPKDVDYLFFMVHLADTLSDLTSGIISDPISRMFWGREAWKDRLSKAEGPFEMHVRVEAVHDLPDGVWVHTHGMMKFGLPEIEIYGIQREVLSYAYVILSEVASFYIEGYEVEWDEVLQIMDIPDCLVVVSKASPEQGHYTTEVIRLLDLPADDDPAPSSIHRAIDAFVDHQTLEADEVLMVKHEHDGVLRGHNQAVMRISWFTNEFEKNDDPKRVFMAKVGFPISEGGTEYLWVTVSDHRDDQFRGIVCNDPVERNDMQYGQSVEFDENEIFDWMILENGMITEGYFTRKYLYHS